jgi:hypothetical protein
MDHQGGGGGRGDCEVAVFWDYENVPLPENCHAVEVSKCIHNALSKYGRIVERRLYSDSRKWNAGLSTANRRFLDASGFDLVDTPSKGAKEAVDKKMIADVLTFAWDSSMRYARLSGADGRESHGGDHHHQQGRGSWANRPCVVLVTSDGDYAYALSKLRDRGVHSVVLYGRDDTVSQILVDTADDAYSFEKDILASIIKKDSPMGFSPHRSSFSKDSVEVSNSNQQRLHHDYMSMPPPSRVVKYEPSITPAFSSISSATSLGTAVQQGNLLLGKVSTGGAIESIDRGTSNSFDEEDVLIFCKGVQSVQLTVKKKGIGLNSSINDCWATDLHVGGYFKKSILTHPENSEKGTGSSVGGSDKQRYQQIRAYAISRGYVEAGRRRIIVTHASSSNVKEIIPVTWDSNAGKRDGLSSEVYLRLTEKGKMRLQDYQSRSTMNSNAYFDLKSSHEGRQLLGSETTQSGLQHQDQRADNFNMMSQCFGKGGDTSTMASSLSSSRSMHPSIPPLDVVKFCLCVKRIQDILSSRGSETEYWATDASVAEQFRKFEDSKPRYKEVRELAICQYEFVEVGRRNRRQMQGKGGGMVLVQWRVNAGKADGLSDEFYLKLTAKGEHITMAHQSSLVSDKASVLETPGLSEHLTPSLFSRQSSAGSESGDQGRSDSARSMSEQSISQEEGVNIFCESVKSLQNVAIRNSASTQDFVAQWVTDSTVSSSFRNSASSSGRTKVTGKDYKSARDRAIRDKLVDVGRRMLTTHGGAKQIVEVNWLENAGRREGLASEVYLRLSEKGDHWLAGSDQPMQEEDRGTPSTITVQKEVIVQRKTGTGLQFTSSPIVEHHTTVGSVSTASRFTMATLDPSRQKGSDSWCDAFETATSSSEVTHVAAFNEAGSTIVKRQRKNPETSRLGNFSSAANNAMPNLSEHTLSFHDSSSQKMSRESATDTSEDAHDASIFLRCITKAQLTSMQKEKGASQKSDSWATDSSVAGLFIQDVGSGSPIQKSLLKKRYKRIRDQSIADGVVDAGRVSLSGVIAKIDSVSEPQSSETQPPELYLRLTELGGSNIATSQFSLPELGRFMA